MADYRDEYRREWNAEARATPNGKDYANDPTDDSRWNDGCDFALTQLCAFLGIDEKSVRWDTATETVEGDVTAVISSIFEAKFGDGFDPKAAKVSVAVPQAASQPRPAAFLAWAADVFGDVALDRKERAMRFLEEALEVAHAEGVEMLIADRIMGRVWKKAPNPAETPREIGQAYACLETYAESIGVSADAEATTEFERVQTFSKDVLRERHQAKVVLGIALNPSSSLSRPSRGGVDE